jgi:hypothetical protein
MCFRNELSSLAEVSLYRNEGVVVRRCPSTCSYVVLLIWHCNSASDNVVRIMFVDCVSSAQSLLDVTLMSNTVFCNAMSHESKVEDNKQNVALKSISLF